MSMNGISSTTLNAKSIETMSQLLKTVTNQDMNFMNKLVKYNVEQQVGKTQNSMKEFGIGTILDMYA